MNDVMLPKSVETQKKTLPLINAGLRRINAGFDSFLIRVNPRSSAVSFWVLQISGISVNQW